MNCVGVIKKRWGQVILGLVLMVIVGLNFKWGYHILGNDNYSPDVNIDVSLDRLFVSPAWRNYRALGVASDADQADIFRVGVFWLLGKILPTWLVGQGFVWLCFVGGVWSLASWSKYLAGKVKKNDNQFVFLVSGLTAMLSLLGVWLFYSPLVPFMVVWWAMPLVLYRLSLYIDKGGVKNWWMLIFSYFLMTTSAIVPTIFIVESIILGWWWVGVWLVKRDKYAIKRSVLSVVTFVLINMFWLLPFFVYVQTNSSALKDSLINRRLTATMIENEVKYNTILNVPRFFGSWFDVKNNDGSWWFKNRDWYAENSVSYYLTFIPVIMVLSGLIFLLKNIKSRFLGLWFGILLVIGWFLIKGINPPFGWIYGWMQTNIPLFEQVFRWQSSKLWPMLLVTMPVIVGLGWSQIVKQKRVIKMVVGSAMLLVCVYFWWPSFRGSLVRERNYVKIPQEYYELGDFIADNNLADKRMYLAPEANTLYFRNYNFGFFGSSLMNYLIPNPVIDKAMTTGSLESEDVQELLIRTMYGGSREGFMEIMNRYNVDLVLIDRNAGSIENGYDYDWEIVDRVISDNGNLKLVWNSENLYLYKRVDDVLVEDINEIVSDGHDWRMFNIARASVGRSKNYISSDKRTGNVYPLVWKYDQVDFDNNKIVLIGKYLGEDSFFSFKNENVEEENWPMELVWDKQSSSVELKKISPVVEIGDKKVSGEEFGKILFSGQSRSEPKFLSINGQVIDLTDTKYVGSVGGKSIVEAWQEGSKEILVQVGDEGNPWWVADQNGVVEVEIEIIAEKGGQVNSCIWLEDKYRCINKTKSAWLREGVNNVTFLVSEVILKDEKITFFVEDVVGITEAKFGKIKIKQYSNKIGLEKNEQILGETDQPIYIEKGSQIKMILPDLSNSNYWNLATTDGFGPDVAINSCFERERGSMVNGRFEYKDDGSVYFETTDCWGGISSSLETKWPNDGLSLIAYKGVNKSGIPLDISIDDDKKGFHMYDDRLVYKGETNETDLIWLPSDWKKYKVSVFSSGYGPRSSVNELVGMVVLPIPKSWLSIRLEPVNQASIDGLSLISNNQAVSLSWILKGGRGERVRVNGWEQGFLVNDLKETKIIFWPNYLVYGGYGLIVIVLGVSLIWTIRTGFQVKKDRF